ncbi:MAG: phosphotransferase [Sciscionella sp.]
MSLEYDSQTELLHAELNEVFGPHRLTPSRHTNQRNHAWLLHSEQGVAAVVKWYRWLSEDAIAGVIEAERRARDAGVPVPGVLYRSTSRPLVVYAYVSGEHRVPDGFEFVDACAELFVRQLGGLDGFRPMWTPARPLGLPRRAQEAVVNSQDRLLGLAISESWQRLAQLALDQPAVASHSDWRADNILVHAGQVAAVLDWEDVVVLPAAEAVGYGAGSLTHSWRETLYRPVALPPVMRFLEVAARRLTWEPGAPEMVHARLAALFTCAVRLAEDQHRGRSAVTHEELRATLGG